MTSPREEAVTALLTVSTERLVEERRELQAAAQAAGLTPDEIAETLGRRSDLPRPLLAPEREILLAVLNAGEFAGREALLAQTENVLVEGYCGCGCATVELRVAPDAPAAVGTPSPIPNEARAFDEAGDEIGGIVIFLDEGRLSLFEIYSHFDPISPFPPLQRLDLVAGSER